MAQTLFSPRPQASNGGFRIAAPYLGDTVSSALCSAYRREDELPADMAALLRALDEPVEPRN